MFEVAKYIEIRRGNTMMLESWTVQYPKTSVRHRHNQGKQDWKES